MVGGQGVDRIVVCGRRIGHGLGSGWLEDRAWTAAMDSVEGYRNGRKSAASLKNGSRIGMKLKYVCAAV